jgi:transposase
MAIVHKERVKKYANDSKEKIRSILETWDFEAYGLISQRNIAKNFNINIKTVEKYYSEFKQDIQEMNMAEKLTNNKLN